MGKLYLDPETQETSHGEDPLRSFQRLSKNWSQLTVLLAPGKQLSDGPEKTYPDLLPGFYRSRDNSVAIYRLAVPNITYMEALWYLVYLTEHRELEPGTLVLRLNYETFRKTGIRCGMLNMLSRTRSSHLRPRNAFRSSISAICAYLSVSGRT